MRYLAQLRNVVTLVLNQAHEGLVSGTIDPRRAGHQPDVIARLAADDSYLVVWVDVHDSIIGFERPDELHFPNGVVLRADESHRIGGFEGAAEGAFIVGKSGGYFAIAQPLIILGSIVDVLFNESWDVGNHKPAPHKFWEVQFGGQGEGFICHGSWVCTCGGEYQSSDGGGCKQYERVSHVQIS